MDLLADFNLSLEDLKAPDQLQFDEELAGAGDLMSKAVTLENLYQEITKSNSVSRAQIEYLKDSCGVDFGPNYPAGSFTVDPSQVNLQIAKEGFVQEFFTSLQSFLKKVIAIIIGILKWIWDTLTGGKKLRESSKTVAENAKVIEEANVKIKKELANAGVAIFDEADPAMQALKENEAKWAANWSLWRKDYLEYGRFSQFLDAYSDIFHAFFPSVHARVDLFKELITIKEDPDDFATTAELNSRFYRTAQPIPVAHFVALFHKELGAFDTKGRPETEMTYLDVADNLQGLSQYMMHTKSESNPEEAAALIQNTKRKFGETLLHNNETEARLTNQIIEGYKSLMQTKPQQAYSDQARMQYKAVIDSMTMEIRGLQMTVATYSALEVAIAQMLKDMADQAFALNTYLEEKIKKMDPKSAYYKHAKEILEDSRKALKRLR